MGHIIDSSVRSSTVEKHFCIVVKKRRAGKEVFVVENHLKAKGPLTFIVVCKELTCRDMSQFVNIFTTSINPTFWF